MARALVQKEFTAIPAAERSNPAVRKRLSAPAMRTFLNIAKAWGVPVIDQQALLGHPAASTYHKHKAGQIGTLSFDVLTRISLLIGIYKALHILYADDALADRWPTLPNSNPLFGGRSPLVFMAEAGMDGLYQVRRLLDGRRG